MGAKDSTVLICSYVASIDSEYIFHVFDGHLHMIFNELPVQFLHQIFWKFKKAI